MDTKDTTSLGMVTSVAVIQKPGSKDKLMIVGQSEDRERWVRFITKGAAKTLWFYLTQILYPRAADQLTQRASTAMLSAPPDSAALVARASR